MTRHRLNKGFLVCVDNFYYHNKLFDLSNPVNRDDAYYTNHLLRETLKRESISFNTYDYYTKKDTEYFLVFFDLPKDHEKIVRRHREAEKFLFLFESEVIKPKNYKKEVHAHFSKVFTWHDDLVDGRKYYKSDFPNRIPVYPKFDLREKTKFCVMISGNKTISHPLEIYSERINAIRWFEKNHPEEFDLYGVGWDRYYFSGALSKLNRFKRISSALKPKYPSYRGTVKSKNDTMRKYKYAICYENAKGIPGYITEKIFDCFFAGCVPVYWGAPNVQDHIPKDTFIDKRDFKTYEDLYRYLKNMDDEDYSNYLQAIEEFLKSEAIYPYSAEGFVETFMREIIGYLDGK